MADVMLKIWDVFLFGMSPDKPTFKVRVFTSDFIFWIELMNISSKHSNSNFAHSFDFHCLANIAKNIHLWWMVSKFGAIFLTIHSPFCIFFFALNCFNWLPPWVLGNLPWQFWSRFTWTSNLVNPDVPDYGWLTCIALGGSLLCWRIC